MNDLVSIIMPVFNSEKYLKEAIESVINQSYEDWELIIINDGSTDSSKSIIHQLSDARIKYFEQKNKGVSSARNKGLQEMKGNFFCFLDSDDMLTPTSLWSRLNAFNEEIHFVDGSVTRYDESCHKILSKWYPTFQGNPLADLMYLTGNSFVGLTWMIRRMANTRYFFDERITHGEDLLFYLNLARDKKLKYSFTNEEILHYRIHEQSAMQGSLEKLEYGYRYIYHTIEGWPEISMQLRKVFLFKIRRIMFKSYLSRLQIFQAIRALR